ncbi:unnamed protein product [Moneuplotes crassus]|uniref:Uncharacterized protein n=2 Tax=Euplotes crassus TaxID=5936 RepID=A0AAD2D7K0_EUPCR|nr:unnamed protein product [Moneuplotes crassus]
MKTTIFFLICILALSSAYIELTHEDGNDILKELKKRNNGVIVVLFVAEAEIGTELAQTNMDYEFHLINKVLKNYPSFKYAKVNAVDKNYSDLVKATGISISDLYNSPSVLISEDRDGEWIHGDISSSKLKQVARYYNERVNE